MNASERNHIALIKHVNKLLDEFLNGIDPDEFESFQEIEEAFRRFMEHEEAA